MCKMVPCSCFWLKDTNSVSRIPSPYSDYSTFCIKFWSSFTGASTKVKLLKSKRLKTLVWAYHTLYVGWKSWFNRCFSKICKRFPKQFKFSRHVQYLIAYGNITAQKNKFFIKDFFSKCDLIRSFLRFGYIYLRNL